MRVQLVGRGGGTRGEHGVVTVISALLICGVFLALAAFTLDLGMAYTSKRQLQTAADSAALAAAAVYAQYPGTCDQAFLDAHEATAKEAAEEWATQNRPGQTLQWSSPTCVNGVPRVEVTASGSTDTALAPVADGPDEIRTSRSAAAVVDVPQELSQGLVPLALCSAQVPEGPYGASGPVNVYYPTSGDGHNPPPQCLDAGSTAGNWWLLDCPGERTGSASELEQQVANGCSDPVSVVDGAGDTPDPTELSTMLTTTCPTAPVDSDTCLSGNPGDITQGHISDAWQNRIDNGSPVIMPVFCVPPQCATSTITDSGTNAVFPLYKLAAVTVCGYHSKNDSYAPDPSAVVAPCTADAASALMDDTSNDSYLSVVFSLVKSAGSISDIGKCAVGTSCDGGLRRVAMVK